MYKACVAQDARAIDAAGTAHADVRLPAYAMAGLLYANDDPARARVTLRSAFDAGDPASHPFTQKYLSALRVLVPIAEGVTAPCLVVTSPWVSNGGIDDEAQYVKSPMARSSRRDTLLHISDKKGGRQ